VCFRATAQAVASTFRATIKCEMASLEKGRKLLDQKGAGLGPLFMPDCDGNRHADPVHARYHPYRRMCCNFQGCWLVT